MKKLLLLFNTLIFSMMLNAQSNVSLPEAVNTSFSKVFPNAKSVAWDKSGKKYNVSFAIDSVTHEVTFKDTGVQIYHKYPVSLSALPKEVMDGLEKEFSTNRIETVYRIEDDGKIQYELSLPSGDTAIRVLFSEKGVFVRNLSE